MAAFMSASSSSSICKRRSIHNNTTVMAKFTTTHLKKSWCDWFGFVWQLTLSRTISGSRTRRRRQYRLGFWLSNRDCRRWIHPVFKGILLLFRQIVESTHYTEAVGSTICLLTLRPRWQRCGWRRWGRWGDKRSSSCSRCGESRGSRRSASLIGQPFSFVIWVELVIRLLKRSSITVSADRRKSAWCSWRKYSMSNNMMQ